MAGVRWSTIAQREFGAIVEYLAGNSRVAAAELATDVDGAVSRLSMFPLLGRAVHDFQDPAVRELIVRSYRLIYRVEGDIIVIVTLVHGSRDLMRHLPDGPWDVE